MRLPQRIPLATYRLQMNHHFPFAKAEEAVPYFSALGISHCYSSPITQARKGSLHGYDVVRFDRINEEIGGLEGLETFVQRLHDFKMGLLLDIVPNHMCVSSSQNTWWYDVLTSGKESPYADFFDIEWDAHYRFSKNRVLVPVLGKILHTAIEDGDIDVVYDRGRLFVTYYDRWFPLHPRTWKNILGPVFIRLKDKLRGVAMPQTAQELDRLHQESRDFRHVLEQYLEEINGMPGERESFDEMKRLLQKQHYRLSYWRMGHERINYRRFFDIFELAGLQQENLSLFDETHRLLFDFLQKGWIDGFRIDHIDGIAYPEDYLHKLQQACRKAAHLDDNHNFYIVVEKILSAEENLRKSWPVYGTTGYDFMSLLNGLFVEQRNRQAFDELYRAFTQQQQGNKEVIYRSKEIVLHTLFISEMKLLARYFLAALGDGKTEHWTDEVVFSVLRETIAFFPVYRTYIIPERGKIDTIDRDIVHEVIHTAKSVNSHLPSDAFAQLEKLLTLQHEEGRVSAPNHREFVRRFQQLTGPVMAKGIEDTAFYRRYPLASLNEVGTEPGHFGVSISQFHERMQERQQERPFSLLATYTHDTKRSEDARARLHVLSEMPELWNLMIQRWHRLNKGKRTDEKVPDLNEEYLIYQSLVATWPLEEMDGVLFEIYLQRIDLYLKKAMKEAKLHTSWVDPDDTHEKDVHLFIHEILDPQASKRFVADFTKFISPIQRWGMWTSLSQLVIKCTVPGVPDFYQGSELWDFRLVDPDNRHPIAYGPRQVLLSRIQEMTDPSLLLGRMETGEIKMYCMQKLLLLRKKCPDLFTMGDYVPIFVAGERGECVIAYARHLEGRSMIVVTCRFFTRCMQEGVLQLEDTHLVLPKQIQEGEYVDIFTRKKVVFSPEKKREAVVSSLLAPLPFGVFVQSRETREESKEHAKKSRKIRQ